MPKNEFALAFNEVLEEKQLSKDIILGAIESAMASAYRKAVNASSAQQVEAKVDTDTGRVTIFAEKEVVEEVQEANTEVTLEEARKANPEAQLGDYAIIHVGFALNLVSEEEAQETLALLRQISEFEAGTGVRFNQRETHQGLMSPP